ncbi:MFS multidrug transporter-like protein [Tricladium varicosporioides]|nr:MFS multidrug transporter-like protein [Hymenoscyphus varicosporioides]
MEKTTPGSASPPEVASVRSLDAGEQEPASAPRASRPVLPKWRFICLVICLSFGLFLSLLDTTIIATALYTIGVDLKALDTSNWVALAYTLSYLGCAVIFARVADVIGRRDAYVVAFIIFFAFSLGCGFAKTINQLIACRVLQGIGGSGLYSLTFVILPEICPTHLLQSIGSSVGAVVAMSGILGPVLGGIITHSTTWRWIFWINAPIGIIPMVLFIIAWPRPHQMIHAPRRSIKQLDFLGAALVIAASVLVVFSFQQAGIHHDSWKSALFIAPLIVGVLCYILLFIWELVVAKFWEDKLMTMFPIRLVKGRIYMGYVLTTLIGGFPYFGIIFNLPLRLQVVNSKSQLVAGVALLPMVGAVAISSAVASMINTKKNRIFLTLLIGACFTVVGTALLSTLANKPEVQPRVYGFQVFVGVGFGLMVSTTSFGGSLQSEPRDRTVSQGIIAQVRVLGGSIGIAASTAIIATCQSRTLKGIVTQEQLTTLETSARTMTQEQLAKVRGAYSDAFKETMWVCTGVAALGVLVAFMSYTRNPRQLSDMVMEVRGEEMGKKGKEMPEASV